MKNKTAEIMSIGTELLLGDIVNTNSAFLAKELSLLGINVYHQSVVGDNKERLENEIKAALERSDILITTGGLGPTLDDISKKCVCSVMGAELVLDEKVLEDIKSFFKAINLKMTDNNLTQAYVPKEATIFYNKWGTAPGFALTKNNKTVIMFPGVPSEMEEMFRFYAKPILAKEADKAIFSRSIKLFGASESIVEELLFDIMENGTNPTIAPYAKLGEVEVRISALAENEKEADKLIAPVEKEVLKLLGDYVYGINVPNIQTAVVNKLTEKNLKLATAESLTGGLVSKMITDVGGSSKVFECGVCSYGNNIKNKVVGVSSETLETYGAVSSQCALEMAKGIRLLSGSDIGISTTGIAGSTDGTFEENTGLVYIAIDTKDFNKAFKLNLYRGKNTTRDIIRTLSALSALNIVLKYIDGKL